MITCEVGAKIPPDFLKPLAEGAAICPVDGAKSCMDLVRRETCGQCVMCRDGTNQVYHILWDATNGKGQSGDMELLKELCGVIAANAGCNLAGVTARQVLASLENQAEEWELHIRRKRCTALMCKAYFTVHILAEKCSGCGECAPQCPEGAISGGQGMIHVIDQEKCTHCGICKDVCALLSEAIEKAGAIKPKTPESPVPVGSWGGDTGRRRRRRG